jgi:hypothetical protein
VPEVSRFFGIVITMYYRDHPPPHFHVRYGAQKALVDIAGLSIIAGTLSPRALGLVTEWGAQHRGELVENWRRAEKQEALNKIDPLE